MKISVGSVVFVVNRNYYLVLEEWKKDEGNIPKLVETRKG